MRAAGRCWALLGVAGRLLGVAGRSRFRAMESRMCHGIRDPASPHGVSGIIPVILHRGLVISCGGADIAGGFTIPHHGVATLEPVARRGAKIQHRGSTICRGFKS